MKEKPTLILIRDPAEISAIRQAREVPDLGVPYGLMIGDQIYVPKDEIVKYRAGQQQPSD